MRRSASVLVALVVCAAPLGLPASASSVTPVPQSSAVAAERTELRRGDPADTTPPVITVTHVPPTNVPAVHERSLRYAFTATDETDGDGVIVRVRARWASLGEPPGRGQYLVGSTDGEVVVTAEPGDQWCFRAVAGDLSNNISKSRASCVTVPVDDDTLPSNGTTKRRGAGLLGRGASVLAGDDHVVVPGVDGRPQRVVLWLPTGPGLGRLLVTRGGVVVRRIAVRATTPGRRIVVLPGGNAPLRLSADRGQVELDAVGYRRFT